MPVHLSRTPFGRCTDVSAMKASPMRSTRRHRTLLVVLSALLALIVPSSCRPSHRVLLPQAPPGYHKFSPMKHENNQDEFINNTVGFTLYVALRPEDQSPGLFLKGLMALYLNLNGFEDYRFSSGIDWLDEVILSSNVTIFVGDAGAVLEEVGVHDVQELTFFIPGGVVDLRLNRNLQSQIIFKEKEQWWWKYDFVYHCYWPGTMDSVEDAVTMAQVRADLSLYINLFISDMEQLLLILEFLLQRMQETLDIRISDVPQYEVTLTKPNTTNVPTASPTRSASMFPTTSLAPSTNTIVKSSAPSLRPSSALITPPHTLPPIVIPPTPVTLNIRVWNSRRYAGLGLLLGTIFMTFVLSQMSRFRKHRLYHKRDWGNMRTQEGVEEILKTGWKITGSKMEVYERKNEGYRDDDSLFMGGYEQREYQVGAEVTVTLPETATDSVSPDSRQITGSEHTPLTGFTPVTESVGMRTDSEHTRPDPMQSCPDDGFNIRLSL